MTEPFDAEAAALELTDYVLEVLHPPANGASLKAMVGAYILTLSFAPPGPLFAPDFMPQGLHAFPQFPGSRFQSPGAQFVAAVAGIRAMATSSGS